jgi:transcriptional regulator with XRE-family HTH domain
MPSRDARHELARFLRTRRERVSPEQVGLPASPRRRTLGLRREEVAVLAGLSPTWYTYLEQARAIRPSPETLDSLARVLQLTEDERQYLHQLALGHVKAERAVAPKAVVNSLITDLVRIAGDSPYPLYAINHACEVIAWNAPAITWYTDWSAVDGIARNMAWWLLTSPEARERIVDWADDARDIVGRLRALSPRYTLDPQFNELITHLQAESEEFRRWWLDHEVRGQRLRTRRFRLKDFGIRSMRLVVVHPADDPGVTMAFHLPESPEDEL